MTLKEYTQDKGIGIKELSKITGVIYPQLYRIANNRNHNVTMKTAERIARGTKEAFGTALMPWEYLDLPTISRHLGEDVI